MRRLLAVLALGAVVVACSEQATNPQTRTAAIAPMSDISNAPAQSGIVVRYGFPTGVIWEDASTGLVAWMGTDAYALCADHVDDPWNADWSIVTYADRVRFGQFMGELGQARDVPTQVFEYGGGHLPEMCASVLAGAELLASGVSQGTQVFDRDWSTGIFSYHGILTRPDGSRAVFHFSLQFKKNVQTKVSVTLK